jgi:anti-anti-sigma factor
VNQRDFIKTIRLSGELEIARKDEIREALRRSAADRAVLVDLSDVTYADSVALTELLRFCVSSSHDSIPVALVVQTPQFARVVQYAGLAGAFKIFDDRDAALAYLAQGAAE